MASDYFTESNPYEKDGKWYWYDESGDSDGPFDTFEEAQTALNYYVEWMGIG